MQLVLQTLLSSPKTLDDQTRKTSSRNNNKNNNCYIILCITYHHYGRGESVQAVYRTVLHQQKDQQKRLLWKNKKITAVLSV